MSTVIWYKGVLYADRRLSQGDNLVWKDGKQYPEKYFDGIKMFQHGNAVYAVTGKRAGWVYFQKMKLMAFPLRIIDRLITWKLPTSWLISWDGKDLHTWNYRERKFFGITFSWWEHEKVNYEDETLLTMGSGGEYAREAINLGLTPHEAIAYASDRDPYTDSNVNHTIFEVGNEVSEKANPIQVLVHLCEQYVLQWKRWAILGLRKGEVLQVLQRRKS